MRFCGLLFNTKSAREQRFLRPVGGPCCDAGRRSRRRRRLTSFRPIRSRRVITLVSDEKTLTSLSGGATVSAKLPKEPQTGAGSSLADGAFGFVTVSAWAMAHPGHSTCEQAIPYLPYPHAESHTVNNVRPLTLEDKTNVQ